MKISPFKKARNSKSVRKAARRYQRRINLELLTPGQIERERNSAYRYLIP